ncbi:hypothetical protein FHS29_001268 [Saccharothrix tamanrassetensis]|uniref:Secreted protein n=1 Tax=Saccharothrix tamanrassetensis TaxID=1051531 RepID=A0A841CEU3_9PSEU|nr:hypothetical protein [Saccharothrix tamanrassetensis]MBB5954698.1 hypothetical protein [Saccharothrix tamanrassetensis]
MRTLGKLVVATTAALILTAPAAQANPLGVLGGNASVGGLLTPVTKLLAPVLGPLGG